MKPTELLASLRKLRSTNLAEITDRTAREVSLRFAREQLATGGRKGGVPWAGYQGEPKYAAYKQAVVGHLEPLRWERQTGGLEDALTNPSSRLRTWTRAGGKVTLSIGLDYVDELENGGVGPFGERFPARPIFPAGPYLRRLAVASAQDKFLVEVQRAGLKVTR